jgi:putative methionine-R-sulfoxide reductase with GAF domain/ADP-ribose pyrophosphatase YjhB (NUDIX family)
VLTNDFVFCPKCACSLAPLTVDDSTRLQCTNSTCQFTFWGNPTPAVGAVVEHNGDIVLARNAVWPDGMFALVTGYLERNEDPVKGIAREVKEELGLDVVETHIIGNYIFERKNEVMLCYHVVCEGEINLGDEIAEVKRYKPHELRPWPRATGFALADWMRSRGLTPQFIDFPSPIEQRKKLIEKYLERSALADRFTPSQVEAMGQMVEAARMALVRGKLADHVQNDANELYRYVVPKLGEDGACSIFDEMEAEPYDLSVTLGGINEANTQALVKLKTLVQLAQEQSAAGWLGIYQARASSSADNAKDARSLTKLAYLGKPSRAEFPLTQAFAEGSTNSKVGLSGQAVIIDDVAAWQAQGGGFYVCDPEVQSEACVPIFNRAGEVIGIIDAEAQPLAHFDAQHLMPIVVAAAIASEAFPKI